MLNKDGQLIGKLHYMIQAGAKIRFDQFDEEGNVTNTVEVITNESLCVYVEDSTVDVSPVSLLDK